MELYDLDLTEEINARAEKLNRRWWKNRPQACENPLQREKRGRVVCLDRGEGTRVCRALYEVEG